MPQRYWPVYKKIPTGDLYEQDCLRETLLHKIILVGARTVAAGYWNIQ